MSKYSDVYDANNLIESFFHAEKGSNWKESVQRFEYSYLKNTKHLQKALKEHIYQQKPLYEFELHERGKIRPIKSMHISDRVVQRSACDFGYIPELKKLLIYDNGASMKDKGVTFARKRLETHLHKYYRHHGSEGYILLIDCTKFFDNIRHDKLIEAVNSKIDDPELRSFFVYLIDQFKVDVSYMTDEEFEDCINEVYNATEHGRLPRELFTGEKFMGKSVGIGSQISQVCGVYFPTRIDNYVKCVKGCKYYARYMDDSYIIHHDKKFLLQLQEELKEQYEACGLILSEKKTKIQKLNKFTWLQTKYSLTESGRVVKRLSRANITRMRRKLKGLKHLYEEGKVSEEDVRIVWQSWKGNAKKHYHAYQTIKSMEQLYVELFPDWNQIENF